jgi:membrane protease subunit (stomatin/prohibitin family)
MLRRRRPLLRAAMVGGAGYVAGRRMAEREQHEAYQDEQLGQTQQSPVNVPAPSPSDRIEALSKAKELMDSGVLSQQEFEAEKARILRGG